MAALAKVSAGRSSGISSFGTTTTPSNPDGQQRVETALTTPSGPERLAAVRFLLSTAMGLQNDIVSIEKDVRDSSPVSRLL